MRKHLFVLSILSLVLSNIAFGQSTAETTPIFSKDNSGSATWKYSPDLTEDELYMYDRLLYMSRDDWEMFRSDPRYDDQRVRDIYREHKGKLKGFGSAMGSQKSMTDDCDCWIEPDNSYTESDPNNWPNCGGGGPGVDCWIGPISLPFDFCFFGQDFNQIVLTSKGTIVMGTAGYFDWTPSEFPTPIGAGEPQYDHICAFWADFDFRNTGELFYKVTDEAFYLNYIDAGYYANHGDKTNTFQIIMTANNAGIIPGNNNVQFCYRDMQWAHGDVGGNGGFNGPNPTTVGADRVAGTSHIQFGRFNLNSSVYNGPYGQAANQQDGVNWLDFQTLEFNTCATAANIAPIPTASAPCDTIDMCLGESYDLNMQFLSPETGQTTSILVTQTGTGLTSSSTNGNTANLTASFTASASNIGLNTVTINATDNGNPAQTTTLTYVFNVLDIQPPSIDISGTLAICAGGETLLSASPGFDSYTWSSGCDEQDCLVEDGGNVTVVGYMGACSATATVFIDATEYFIPAFVGGNSPQSLCPGITSEVCLAQEWTSYNWYVYPGYDGNIPTGTATDEQCFEISGNNPGYYAVIVENEEGCEGLNIQQVVQVQSFIDEDNDNLSGAYCDGLENVEFTGGYSNPANGELLVYCQDQSSAGWQGAYITLEVTHLNGTTDSYIMTTGGSFSFYDAPITLGDTFILTYTSNGNTTLDENNYFWVVNCNGEIFQSPIGMTEGVIYEGVSSCQSQALSGNWTVTGPAGWSLTTTTQYNPIVNGVESPNVFTPGGYGLYELCFNDPTCDIDHCYTFEYTEAPSLSLLPDGEVLLCGNETSQASITVTDIGGTGEITWSGTGVVPSANGLSATAGPYNNYMSTTVTATITNGCGTASENYSLQHQPDVPAINLQDQFLCANGSVTLDPVASSNDNANLIYDWTGGLSGASPNVTSSGNYCVTVSNLCGTSPQVCADVVLVPVANAPTLQANIVECNDDQVTLSTQVPTGYSITWSNGTTNSNSITVTSSGNYCFDITDLAGCDTHQESCSNVVIATAPTTMASSPDELPVCPGECEVLDLNAVNGASYSWTTSCSGLGVNANSSSISVCSENIPLECQLLPFTVTGTATNVCGSASTTYILSASACFLKIPNVITPNGDSENDTFYIEGLNFYPKTKVRFFDRWGKLLYESDNYRNDFGRDLNPGTYYYIIELPFGVTTLFEGHFTVLQ
ncbi:MAG: gliding motility-associated C-terminal domain-containing protein [Flavobacteriales bacterium]